MSNRSNDLGRAFEYACIMELKAKIEDHRPVIIKDETINASLRAWGCISEVIKNDLMTAAGAYIDTLFRAEPLILECEDKNTDIIELSINKDSDAEGGDVRDIVITRGQIRWDIGLSLKHNHFETQSLCSQTFPTFSLYRLWF